MTLRDAAVNLPFANYTNHQLINSGYRVQICFISHQSQLEGAERSLLDLIRDLKGKGVGVNVIVLKKSGPLMRELDALNVRWESVPSPWWTRRMDGPVYSTGPVFNRIVRAAERITHLIDAWGIDLVYTNTSVVGPGAIAAALAGKPHIWHIREAASQPDSYEFLMSHADLESFVNSTSNRVIFNSQAVQSEWTTGRLPASKTDVVYNRITLPAKVSDVKSRRRVDVIIPMHNDPFILRCLGSVVLHRSESLNSVIILDDMSDDENLIQNVKGVVDDYPELMTYSRNDRHLGFVGTCNRGMALSEHDVVLLNSDTLVTANWVEKLRKTACHQSEIGTVTPMSNNASLVSLPELYGNNPDDDPDRTSRWIESLASADFVDIPTAHGFCIYIKREAINRAGVFDSETFGMGYGEENDFSMRLVDAGFRNVASCRTYVYHKGAQSFGQNKRKELIDKNYRIVTERYPGYTGLLKGFREYDPFLDLREPLRQLKKNPDLESSFKIAIVGTIVRWKNQLNAVEAVDNLIKQGKDISLWICGSEKDSSYAAEIKSFAEARGIGDRILFTGNLHNAFGLLSFCDAAVVCSAFEPFGRVTLESMLAGTPVVGADAGGTRELIRDGETGVLYPPGDVDALASKIESLIDNPETASRIGRDAKRWSESFNREAEQSSVIFDTIQEEAGKPNPSAGIGAYLASIIPELRDPDPPDGLLYKFMRRLKSKIYP